MSQGDINKLLDIWSLYQKQMAQRAGRDDVEAGPFENYQGMYSSIDDIQQGSAPWKCFQMVVEENPPFDAPEWQTTSYQVWYRDPATVISNILANPELAKDFSTTPYVQRNKQGTRQWCDFMSGNFAWRHAVSLCDPSRLLPTNCFIYMFRLKYTTRKEATLKAL